MITHKLSVGELRRLTDLGYYFYLSYPMPTIKLPINNSTVTLEIEPDVDQIFMEDALVSEWLSLLVGSEKTFSCDLKYKDGAYYVYIIIPEGGF